MACPTPILRVDLKSGRFSCTVDKDVLVGPELMGGNLLSATNTPAL